MTPARSASDAARGRADEIDLIRAGEYRLIARLLAGVPDAPLLAELAALAGDATPIGTAHGNLAAAARKAEPKRVEREYFRLFIGVGRGELLPYASYYRTGFLHERPLAELRRDLAALGIERAEGHYEPEDHVSVLFDTMAALACGEVAPDAVSERDFFVRHLEPWAGRFFEDLSTAPSADFYKSVGRLGATFVAIEARAFALGD